MECVMSRDHLVTALLGMNCTCAWCSLHEKWHVENCVHAEGLAPYAFNSDAFPHPINNYIENYTCFLNMLAKPSTCFGSTSWHTTWRWINLSSRHHSRGHLHVTSCVVGNALKRHGYDICGHVSRHWEILNFVTSCGHCLWRCSSSSQWLTQIRHQVVSGNREAWLQLNA